MAYSSYIDKAILEDNHTAQELSMAIVKSTGYAADTLAKAPKQILNVVETGFNAIKTDFLNTKDLGQKDTSVLFSIAGMNIPKSAKGMSVSDFMSNKENAGLVRKALRNFNLGANKQKIPTSVLNNNNRQAQTNINNAVNMHMEVLTQDLAISQQQAVTTLNNTQREWKLDPENADKNISELLESDDYKAQTEQIFNKAGAIYEFIENNKSFTRAQKKEYTGEISASILQTVHNITDKDEFTEIKFNELSAKFSDVFNVDLDEGKNILLETKQKEINRRAKIRNGNKQVAHNDINMMSDNEFSKYQQALRNNPNKSPTDILTEFTGKTYNEGTQDEIRSDYIPDLSVLLANSQGARTGSKQKYSFNTTYIDERLSNYISSNASTSFAGTNFATDENLANIMMQIGEGKLKGISAIAEAITGRQGEDSPMFLEIAESLQTAKKNNEKTFLSINNTMTYDEKLTHLRNLFAKIRKNAQQQTEEELTDKTKQSYTSLKATLDGYGARWNWWMPGVGDVQYNIENNIETYSKNLNIKNLNMSSEELKTKIKKAKDLYDESVTNKRGTKEAYKTASNTVQRELNNWIDSVSEGYPLNKTSQKADIYNAFNQVIQYQQKGQQKGNAQNTGVMLVTLAQIANDSDSKSTARALLNVFVNYAASLEGMEDKQSSLFKGIKNLQATMQQNGWNKDKE